MSFRDARWPRWLGGLRRCAQIGAAVLIGVLATLQGATASYRLDNGDIVDVAILGKPELSRRAPVNPDGNIVLPLFGDLHVAGLTLDALRSRLTGMLPPDQIIRASDLIVDLAEARPITVAGEVNKPGAYPFRAGLTVAHAIALAGGEARQAESGAGFGVDLASRIATLRTEYLRQQIRIASLTAEMADQTAVALPNLGGRDAERQGMADLASHRLQAEASDREQERSYLRRSLDLADQQIAALQKGLQEDNESARQQDEELQRITGLSRTGLSNPGRVSEEQRAASLLKSRQMDTSARLARARQDREELARHLEKTNERKQRIPAELEDAFLAVENVRAQLRALAVPENLLSQPGGSGATQHVIEIVRWSDGSSSLLQATEDTALEPGDLVKVSKGRAAERVATH